MVDNKSEAQTDMKMNVDFEQIALNIRRRSYKCIGVGSGRIVFDLGNKYVVKVAKNVRGIAQNESEYKIALDDDTQLFAKILHASERFRFLIMEKAEKIKNISYVWNYYNVKNNEELYQLKELQDISRKYNLVLRDFGRTANWGQINGKPIIIDYGFTQQVCKKFY